MHFEVSSSGLSLSRSGPASRKPTLGEVSSPSRRSSDAAERGEFRADDGSLHEVAIGGAREPACAGVHGGAHANAGAAAVADDERPARISFCTRLGGWARSLGAMTRELVGASAEKVGSVLAARAIADIVAAAVETREDNRGREGVLLAGLAVANTLVGYQTARTLMTTTRTGANGREEVVHRLPAGFAANRRLSAWSYAAVAQLANLMPLMQAQMAGLRPTVTSTIKVLSYVLARGQIARAVQGIRRDPAVVDGNNRPVPAGRIPATQYSAIRRLVTGLIAVPVTFALVDSLINDRMGIREVDDPNDDVHFAVNVYVALYELMIHFVEMAAKEVALRQHGLSLSFAPEAPDPQPAAAQPERMAGADGEPGVPEPGPMAGAEPAHGALAHMKAALETLRVEDDGFVARFGRTLRRLAGLDHPQIYLTVVGYRNFVNLLLNVTTEGRSISGMMDRWKHLPALVHTLMAGFESLGTVLEAGIIGRFKEGEADRDLLDLLHVLFKTSDHVLEGLGAPDPSRGQPVILRQLHPAFREMVDSLPHLKPLSDHFAKLDASLAQRGDSPFTPGEVGYPSPAMRREFGHVTASMDLLDGSRVTPEVLEAVAAHLDSVARGEGEAGGGRAGAGAGGVPPPPVIVEVA